MNVFAQGMRRSGTTIVFDLFWEDGRFDCYYEPLAKARKAVMGGGSGVHKEVDFFAPIREARAAFMALHPGIDHVKLFNHGAPREAELEFEPELPGHCREYIRFLTEQSPNTMIKFTRMYCKLHELHRIDPDALFIHIVRDPRAVTASYLFGKNRKHRDSFPDEDTFFGRTSNASSWNSLRFTDYLIATSEFSHLRGCPDFMRVMLLWKFVFAQTRRGGIDAFGDRYHLLRHEDLLRDPRGVLENLYQRLGIDLPPRVLEWALENIHAPSPLYAADNPAWRNAIEELQMQEEMRAAGYST